MMAPSNKPRLVRVLTRPGVGGAAKHVALLTHGLRDEWDQWLLAGPPRAGEGDFWQLQRTLGDGDSETHEAPYTLASLRREAAPGRDLRVLRDLVRHFRVIRPQLIDTHLSKAGILGRLAARIARVPATTHTFHINIFVGYGWNSAERELYLRLERAAARWSSRLLCLSDELGHELQTLGIGTPEQWRTVQLGIDLAPFLASPAGVRAARCQVRAELGVPDDAPLVGLIARLAPVKSIKTFLEAAQVVHRTRPDVHFVIVGDGESRARLEQLARALDLSQRTHFLGLRADIAHLNLAFDGVALTSLQEGTPVSLIESLAAQKPVVATDVGGVSRLIQHEVTGLLVPPRDASATAAAILRVLNSPAAAQSWAAAGRALVQREWSVERMLADHRALYREVVAAASRPHPKA